MSEKIKPISFYVIFFLFLLAFSTTAVDYDYDLWARLIAGMGFVQTGHVLKHDFLSYTPTHTWFDHEWGSSVIFYLTQHFFPYAGIIALQTILIFLTFFVITKFVELRGVKTTSAYNFLFYYFAFISMSQVLNNPIRCQLFSFLFFTIFLYILESARQGNNKMLWFTPLIMIIWNNLHGGCISGIGLILIYIIGEFFNRKPVKKYIYALIGTIIVLPINPWGFEYVKFLITANFMARPNITEWMGLFSKYYIFKYMKFKIFASILLLTEFTVITRKIIEKKFDFDKTKFLVVTITIFLAVQHIKLIPLAVISMTCFFYDDFYTAFNTLTKNIFNKIANFKDTFIYILILIFAFANINSKIFKPLLSWSKYPLRAIEFIKINDIKGNLLTDFGYGSYASYKLYPNNKIFMDGRYEEVYYGFMMPYLTNFHVVKNNWYRLLELFPTDVVLLEKYYPVCKSLKTKKDWKQVFEDNKHVVFIKSKNTRKYYKTPSSDLNYYKKTLFDTKINFETEAHVK